ncbi:MAG: hypothetical protein QXR60_01995 [Candidatus Nanoarchaeia archaeon]
MADDIKRCHFCNKSFRIIDKPDVIGNVKPENYVLRKNEYGEEQYFEKECWVKYAQLKMRNRKQEIRDEFKEIGL